MLYRISFYATLLGWIYGLGELSRQGAELIWFALFSIAVGCLSHIMYARGYQAKDLTGRQQAMLWEGAQMVLLTYFAGLTLIMPKIPAPVRGILVGAGFYFLVYWLLGLKRKRMIIPE